MIGHFLELILVGSGPMRWWLRKTGCRRSLTELGTGIKKPIG